MIKGRVEFKNGGDAAGHFFEVFGFFEFEVPVQNLSLSVAEPLFDDLVAAEGVFPDRAGDAFEPDVFVKEDFEALGGFFDAALGGHDGVAGAVVSPAGGDGEVLVALDGDVGVNADGVEVGGWGEESFGIEEGGKFAAEAGGGLEEGEELFGGKVGLEGDAGPVLAEGAVVFLGVDGGVEDGEGVEEEVGGGLGLGGRGLVEGEVGGVDAEAVEVGVGLGGEVPAALGEEVDVAFCVPAGEKCWELYNTPLHSM